MDAPDNEAFGKWHVRCKLVRIAYLIHLPLWLIVCGAAALGTFIESFRCWANDHTLPFYIAIGIGLGIFTVMGIVVWVLDSLRTRTPLNLIIVAIGMLIFAIVVFCVASILDIGAILGMVLTMPVYLISIIVLSLFLDVAHYPMYLMTMVVVMAPLVGALTHLYIEDKICLTLLIIAIIFGFCLCVGYIINTVWSLKAVEETKLEETDYVQEAVYIFIGQKLVCCKKSE